MKPRASQLQLECKVGELQLLGGGTSLLQLLRAKAKAGQAGGATKVVVALKECGQRGWIDVRGPPHRRGWMAEEHTSSCQL